MTEQCKHLLKEIKRTKKKKKGRGERKKEERGWEGRIVEQAGRQSKQVAHLIKGSTASQKLP